MIKNIDQIKDAVPIREVIGHFVQVPSTKSKINCPFHDEKTASFSIDDKRNIAKCFGQCDQSYDSVEFLKEQEGMSFVEAMEYLSELCQIPLEYDEAVSINQELTNKKKQLVQCNNLVLKYGLDNLGQQQDNKKTLQSILKERAIIPDVAQQFGLFVLQSKGALSHAFGNEAEAKKPLLEELGIIRTDGMRTYDVYSNRLVFPVKNRKGQVVGFAGRCLSAQPKIKYINSKESDIYKKNTLLYGLSENQKAIRKTDSVFVVEGYFDVLAMASAGIENVVGVCGTAMAENQLVLLSRYTRNIVLLLDGDKAGTKAALSIIPKALELGLYVEVCSLPENHDPNSYLMEKGKEAMSTLFQKTTKHGIQYVLENADISSNQLKQEVLKEFLDLLLLVDNEFLVEDLKVVAVKKLGIKKTKLNRIVKELQSKQGEESSYLESFSKEEMEDINRYGFFERNNSYYKVTDKNVVPLSNFKILPLYHLMGDEENTRLLEICNRENVTKLVSFSAKNLVSVDSFAERVECHGNYIFYGTKRDLNMIKSKIFERMESCKEVSVLGHQKAGFYAFANGILHQNIFTPINDHGIVTFKGGKYYIPMNAITNKDREGDYDDEKKFIYQKSEITFKQWAEAFTKVYFEDDNGRIAILFHIASLYRDIIFSRFKFFPHLFLFGQKGTGKSQMAWSLGSMFGFPQNQLMLDSGTKVAIGRKAAKFRNANVWYDEYKNSIRYDRIQFLKGAYDGAGHARGKLSSDNRTSETKINSASIISGQDLPTRDVALFSRSILLTSTITSHAEEAVDNLESLKRLEEEAQLSSVTGYLLSFRESVEKTFSGCYDDVFQRIKVAVKAIKGQATIEDRILKNMVVVLSPYWAIRNKLEVKPFSDENIIAIAAKKILKQCKQIRSTGDLSQFWDVVMYHAEIRDINSGIDYLVREERELNVINPDGEKRGYNLPDSTKVLYLRTSKVFSLYRESFRRQNGANGLDKSTLISYLEHSDAYLGKKKSFRFSSAVNSSCLVFRFDKLDIEIGMEGTPSSDENNSKIIIQ